MSHPSTAAAQRHRSTRPFANVVLSEWQKIASQRSQRRLGVIAVAVAPLAAAIFLASLPVTQGMTLRETLITDILTASLLGIDVATIACIVFAAFSVGTEYSTGLIAQSLSVTPDRVRLLAAKVSATTIVLALMALLAVGLVSLVAVIAIVATGREGAEAFTGGGFRLLAGTAVMPVFYGVVAILCSVAFRTTAAGLLIPLAILVGAGIVRWFGSGVEQLLTPLTPLAGLHSISGLATGLEDIGAARGALILIVWIVLAYGLAQWRFSRKDA